MVPAGFSVSSPMPRTCVESVNKWTTRRLDLILKDCWICPSECVRMILADEESLGSGETLSERSQGVRAGTRLQHWAGARAHAASLVIVHVTGTNDCTFLFQAKRRLELGESGHQYLSDGLKTPKGKGRAALRSPDSPKSKDSFISDSLWCGLPTFKACGWKGAKVWETLACFVLCHFFLCLSKK